MEINNNGKYVRWAVFIAVVGFLIIGIGWNLARTESLAKQVENYSQDVQATKILLASIGTDLVWIKTTLAKIQENFDNHMKTK